LHKVIITVAPTGNVPTKALNPATPVTNDEIVQDLLLCQAAGASIAHLHVRDVNENPTSERTLFKDLCSKIDSQNINMIKQLSTGARGGQNTIDYRGQMLDLNIEMASLATGSSNFPTSVNGNSPELIEALATKMYHNNIKPEIEVFDSAMIANVNWLIKKGIIKSNLHFNLVMNVPGSLKGTPRNLMFLKESLPQGSTFSVSGIGKSQTDMLAMAIILGGHVRTGLEDLVEYRGSLMTNEGLVQNAANLIRSLGREVATTQEAKSILGL